MQEIQSYKVTWRPSENVGMIHLCLVDGAASVPIDSAMEMMMLVDLLRNEAPVYYDARHEVVLRFGLVGNEVRALEKARGRPRSRGRGCVDSF